jgi:hypothetical protein
MSRSNTHYWNLCSWWEEIGEDGYCKHHRPFFMDGKQLWGSGEPCIPPGKFETRRGLVKRRPRFPKRSVKSWHQPPPLATKKLWRRWIRSKYGAEMKRHPSDPELFGYNKAFAGKLWSWY